VAVMGWDLLAGQTKERRQLMELLWIRRHTTEGHMHADSTEEMSCVEHLCEELCYRLELAYFVAHVNSGKIGLASNIQTFSKGSQATNEDVDGAPASSFAANLVLERLAMHSPVQVSISWSDFLYRKKIGSCNLVSTCASVQLSNCKTLTSVQVLNPP
jgi:zinc finger FYVE domain-containing protein 26